MKYWRIILAALLVVLFTFWALNRDNFHEVTAGEVYRSAQLDVAALEEVVGKHGIRTVISLRRPKPDESWYVDEKTAAKALGIAHHDIPLDFTFSPRIDHLLELRDLLDNAPRPLLIHCRAGADRTGLAAVMAKLLDESSSLEEARKQASWRFHVFHHDSMGLPLIDEYTAWLENTGQRHSKHNFNHWLENEYVDLSGNVHFLVNKIHGQLWERPWGLIDEGYEFQVRRSELDYLELSGWAFDTRNISLLKGLDVYLGGVRFENSRYGINQPWLIKAFGKEQYLDSGWTANHPLDQFEDGCQDLELKFTRRDGSTWTSPPAARICIQ